MQILTVKGLVLKQTNYAESDRILKIFTQDAGILTVMAKGARKFKSHQGAACNLFCFGEYNLRPSKNMHILCGSRLLNNFYGISESIEKLSLASYLCDITLFFLTDSAPEPEVLKLLLNTLYIISSKDRNLFLIKAVYELKLLSLIGYNIDTSRCVLCQKEETHTFSAALGGMLCKDCAKNSYVYPPSVIQAVRYIFSGDMNNIFSFKLSDDSLKELNRLSEQFILKISEHSFQSLSYFRSLFD